MLLITRWKDHGEIFIIRKNPEEGKRDKFGIMSVSVENIRFLVDNDMADNFKMLADVAGAWYMVQ